MSNIFYTSDLHFSHTNILTYCNRPWDSVLEMNEGLIDNWNSVVGADDITYIIGDVCMGRRDETVPLVSRLNGRKILIPGNHDDCHPMYASRNNFVRRCVLYSEHMEITEVQGVIDTPPVASVCHFPFAGSGDHTDEERYTEWRPVDHGQWLIHGHIHDLWKQNGRMINVGVDVWDYRPVHTDQLLELMS